VGSADPAAEDNGEVLTPGVRLAYTGYKKLYRYEGIEYLYRYNLKCAE
jgi:hypothetical protein